MSINTVTVSGNLTRDAELRRTPAGLPILSFSVAVNERRRKAEGDKWEDVPCFVDCTVLGKRAESLASLMTKGQKVCVCGKLHYSTWERDGQKRSKLDVTVIDVDFMAQPKRQEPAREQQAYRGY